MGARVLNFPPRLKRWSKGPSTFLEITGASSDTRWIGFGSSPYVGDIGNVGVAIPAVATSTQTTRYLVRLCGMDIPSGICVYVRGYRQLAVIGLVDANGYPLEREIVSPNWAFTDGNISWHIRHQPQHSSFTPSDPAQVPGTFPGVEGVDPGLAYNPPLVPYIPPGAGRPPGVAVEHLGTFYDIRNPWQNTDWDSAVPVFGPGQVTFWASVKQTNPESRIQPEQCPPNTLGLRPEDLFIMSVPNAVYRRVGGSLLIEQFPIEAIP